MTTFLGRILARSRDGAADVRPRLPGRFEPLRAPAEPSIPDRNTESQPHDVSEPTVTTSASNDTKPVRRRKPRRVHRGRLDVNEPADVSRDDDTVRASSAAEPRQTAPHDPVRDDGPRVTPSDTIALRTKTRIISRESSPERAGPSEATPRVRAARRERTARDADETAAAIAPAPRPAQRESRSPRPLDVRSRPRESEKESTDEPAIRIHIGRIDVRAVHEAPPAQAPAPRPAAPSLSLEEYARQRGRGKR